MDIERAVGQRILKETILCSDSHVSYKGFAIENEIESHAIRTDLKQFVKQKIYHVQRVNAIDSRLKKWIEYQFRGVSTKYLQKYLNWFKTKEKLKASKDFPMEFANKSLEDTTARNRYERINQWYEELMQLTTQN